MKGLILLILAILATVISLVVSVPILIANIMSNAAGAPFIPGWLLLAGIWLVSIALWVGVYLRK